MGQWDHRLDLLGQRAFALQRRDLGVEQFIVHGDLTHLGFSRAISSLQSSHSRSFRAVAAPASARSRHSVSLAIETFVRATSPSGSPRNSRAKLNLGRKDLLAGRSQGGVTSLPPASAKVTRHKPGSESPSGATPICKICTGVLRKR
jgi:hypothetical protein